ncbi:methyltransferase domain-containing protein [Alteromonas halophila]|uniref:Malonyl-[acyl-carrier protein] O-methyltransferase n=1 Tax=Alteromonas halophila TaxID=516698 RepID=A0A918JD09_9ALTE|nr:methyltransferase domain-containing protein [Alteromonas halophila]GGW75129.1 malonyl-[acyl-carrier protein] O-methyltransferase [Alteromonas halophila]
MSLSVARPLAASVTFSQAIAARFSRAARDYKRYAGVQQQIASHAIDGFSWQDDDVVLDIGSGTGCNTYHIAQRVASAQGVDIAPGMIREAASRYPHITFTQGDAQALPFDDGQFSVVFSSMALQWCAQPAKVLSEIRRVLTPGGRAVLAVMVDGSFAELRAAQHAAGLENTLMPLVSAGSWLAASQASSLMLGCHQQVRYADTFSDMFALLRSISRVGASASVNTGSRHTRRDFQAMAQAYPAASSSEQGLTLSYDVLHVQLEKP